MHLLNDLGWDETIDSERDTLTLSPAEWVRTLARLHGEAAGALRAYVSRPKDEEAVAERNVMASVALAELLSQLASAVGPTDDADCAEGSR